jgi:hypothetical protein
MANEARVSVSLAIKKGNLTYQNSPTSYRATVTYAKGPVPGGKVIATTGTDISFSGLDRPGLCVLQNLDSANTVRYGLHDGTKFRRWGKLKPGEIAHFRFDELFGETADTPGTGTDSGVEVFHMRADTAPCNVRIEAFEAD